MFVSTEGLSALAVILTASVQEDSFLINYLSIECKICVRIMTTATTLG